MASARFPLVLPPLIRRSSGRANTFVDGGYADNSGVAVAGALFGHLKQYAAEHRLRVDLRLIVLTSETTNRRPSTAAESDIFVDFRVPVQALLSVRAGIGAREVARIAERFADPSNVLQIEYGDDFFLGWTISEKTLDSISRQVSPANPTIPNLVGTAFIDGSPAFTLLDVRRMRNELLTRAERNIVAKQTILCLLRAPRKAAGAAATDAECR